MKKINHLIKVVIVLFMMFSLAVNVSADDPLPLDDENSRAKSLDEAHYEKLDFDYGTLKNTNIQSHVSHFNNEPATVNTPTYTATYEKGLTYINNDEITVKVDVVFDKIYDTTSENYKFNYVSIRNDMVLVSTRTTDANLNDCENVDHFSEATVKIYFYDKDGNDYYVPDILLGITDPDAGDYFFDTDREIYYKDALNDSETINWASSYLLTDEGITPKERVDIPFTGPLLLLRLKNENSFEFKIRGYNDNMDLPVFYALKYKIDYELNGGTNDSNNPTEYIGGQEKSIADPSRPGYKFLGWTREDISDPESEKNENVKSDDIGDKKFIAQWEIIEYQLAYDRNHDNADPTIEMENQKATIGTNETKENEFINRGYTFKGWSTTPGEQAVVYNDGDDVLVTATDIGDAGAGDVVKTLYAQWEPTKYKILYDKNADDATGTMQTQEFDVVNNTDEWNSVYPLVYEREGYELEGYMIENDGDLFKNLQDFRDYLLDDEDQKVTLYAQWKPWEYYIKYDGNGADNPGAMTTDTFDYFAESMKSKDNVFKRDGYRFTGFKVTIDGTTRIIRTPEEFVEVLKKMGPYSSITLVAQWDKIPVRFTAPVTGVK